MEFSPKIMEWSSGVEMTHLNTDNISSKLEILDAAIESSSRANPLEGGILQLSVDPANPAKLPDVQGL
jgi:hypothetical protein